ncbi:MAG: (2Fe-2S) ferredoxin domain-containing protein [Methylohalobius sp.]|nr:(2Fe-2S) ferredoxin domain-containing protein [Methylohalobius sp.]
MPKPIRHVFVCTQTRPPGHPKGSCGQRGCGEVFQNFAQKFEQELLYGRYALTATGCLGMCELGPVVLIYPDGVLYAQVQPQDVSEIVTKHLEQGTPVERLLAPETIWG